MTTKELTIFLVALLLPPTYQRIKFAVNKKSFDNIKLRVKTGLQIHHGHWGFAFAFIAMLSTIFGKLNIYTIALSGLGWGLMLDEIPPMLKMPSLGRKKELEVYEGTIKSVIIVFIAVVLLSIVLFTILGKY